MLSLMPTGKQQYFNPTSGRPLAGGLLYTYAAGTSTPKATYQDAAGVTPNTNPITLDSTGSALVYWSGNYKIVLKDAQGNTVYTVDNYNADPYGIVAYIANVAAASGSTLMGFIQAGVGAIKRWVQDKLRERVSVLDYGADPTGTIDSTAAINAAIASMPITGGRVEFPQGGVFKISGPILGKTNIVLEGFGSGRDTLWTRVTLLSTNAAACLDFRDCDHYTIKGLRFDGNSLSTNGIRQGYTSGSSHVAHARIEDVTIQFVTGTAIDTGSGYPAGACNDCTYKDVIIELCGLAYDWYSTNNLVIGGTVAGCTTTGGMRLNTTSEVKAYGTVFSGNKADIIPAGDDFVNGMRCFGTWHETSIDGIIKRYHVPSVNNAIASIVFDGCVLHTSNATNLFDLTNCSTNVVIISGRKDPAAPAQVVIPAGNTVISMGLLDELVKSGTGNLVKMNTGGISHSSTTGALEMGWMKAFGGNIAAASLPGNATNTGAMILGWNRSNGDGEFNVIGAKGGGAQGGVSLGVWDGTTFKHLFWPMASGTAFMANTTSVPGSNPVNGGYLYVESGALKFKGSSGTVTVIAPA